MSIISHTNQLVEKHYDQEKVELIKRTFCKGATDDELQLFIQACKKTGLDPFARQIFAVKRWDSSSKKEVMSIQTAIDGYRLIADRTGKYVPGKDVEFTYDKNGQLYSAKAYVKKMTPDGVWHDVSAVAFWKEYVQTTKEGKPTIFWLKKAHIMLSKCAESLALRKAFPAELSGIYTHDEMPTRGDNGPQEKEEVDPFISKGEHETLKKLIASSKETSEDRICEFFKINDLSELNKGNFEKLKSQIEMKVGKELNAT